MSNKHRELITELRSAGAKASETIGLIEIASQLKQLKVASQQAPQSRWRLATVGLAAIAGILIGAGVMTYSQTSLPGSWAYPAKRLSENVAVAFDPNYRGTLMMRRSLEVEQLVNRRASPHTVLATLADYKTAASAYKSSDYAAFEYCKSNLEQAATAAPTPERSAITNTLSSLQT